MFSMNENQKFSVEMLSISSFVVPLENKQDLEQSAQANLLLAPSNISQLTPEKAKRNPI